MSVKDTIIEAILQKKPLRIIREGHERFICPYRIGWANTGNYNLIHYQFGGYSQRGLGPDGSSDNWRCHSVTSISQAEIIEGPWHEPTVKPKTRGKCVIRADAEVSYY